jgi:hypothetical protein
MSAGMGQRWTRDRLFRAETLGRYRIGMWKWCAAVTVIAAIVSASVLSSASYGAVSTPSGGTGTAGSTKTGHFSYGFDFSLEAPDRKSTNNPAAVDAARRVMASMPLVQDQALMGWGVGNPEPSPGVYRFTSLDRRIDLITSTGGTPVITLCGAPDWMKGGTPGTTDFANLDVAPTPAHYQDFADLAAKVAVRYPQVKYFVVWNEFKGFFRRGVPDGRAYTAMYNDVYRAIKRVRPGALVGGPYAPMVSFSNPKVADRPPAPKGPWGHLDDRVTNAITYWIDHKVGANFVAVDAGTATHDRGLVANPVLATAKYAAADRWLTAHTRLPIWWMESNVQPDTTRWSQREGAAVRVAALLQMASSGARVGLQWQPQQSGGVADEGLWTSTRRAGGGRPTLLATLMRPILTVLSSPVSLVGKEPVGVLVAHSAGGTVAVNGTGSKTHAVIGGRNRPLGPWAVLSTT